MKRDRKDEVIKIFEYEEKVIEPKKSFKFDIPSLYYKRVYYFPNECNFIEEKNRYGITTIYCDRGKWYQDIFYITEEFKDFLDKYNK